MPKGGVNQPQAGASGYPSLAPVAFSNTRARRRPARLEQVKDAMRRYVRDDPKKGPLLETTAKKSS